ncbi:DUF6518 family protein [Nocardiopsis synnemataformans]|uniref:DUF6518 family protein n=1 Tax=Nocardiopsis synnemataformans TaxID=61305 RepID=UPI003EBA0AC6
MAADTEKPAPAPASPIALLTPLAAAVGAGLLAGFLTSYGQGLLPQGLASMANSSASWSLIAFLVGMLSPRPWVSAIAGALSLAAMVLGYDIASVLRGFATLSGATVFWLTAAVLVGPVLGWGGNALRLRTRLAPLAVGAMSGVLVGEGAYGLLYIADTTSPVYWSCSVAAGVAFLVWAAARRLPAPRSRSLALAAGTTAVVATAFVVLYSGDLILWFTG